jgi:DNA-binding NtrC family response regulator
VAWLERQPWRGNVRELEHAIERAAVLTGKAILEPVDLQKGPLPSPLSPAEEEEGRGTLRYTAEAAERDAIKNALHAAGGNRREAAKRLGVSLRTLFYKLARLKLD